MENTPLDPMFDTMNRLQSLLFNVADVDSFLHQLAELAAGVLDPPVSCGINAQLDGRPVTVTSSDHRASRLDETQFSFGDGPCLQAMRTGVSVYVSDVETEQRWTPYIEAARDQGLRSSLSLPLTTHGQTVGAMNFFAFHAAAAFDPEQQQRCAIFAAQAAGALQLATRYLDDAELLDQVDQALSSRSAIDQALGILMAESRCSADAAFEELRRRSTQTNTKLRDVAAEVVQAISGQAPLEGKPFRTDRDRPTGSV